MTKIGLALCAIFCILQIGLAQKVIHNPDYISKNFSAVVTKIELNANATVLHFLIKQSRGKYVTIPKETYIEDASGSGQKIYVTKGVGLNVSVRTIIPNTDELRYSLHFPPLKKEVRRINYGESNPGGNWYIYKLNLTRNGKDFLKRYNNSKIENSVRHHRESILRYKNKGNSNASVLLENSRNTLLPRDLPEQFFGSWYDKFGTLLFIATRDYVVLNSRVQYYLNIQEKGINKYQIETSFNFIEILSLETNTITLRTNRIMTLKKAPHLLKVPELIQGNWFLSQNLKRIKITEDSFILAESKHEKTEDIETYNIDYVSTSENGALILFVLYHKGTYKVYYARKEGKSYELYSRERKDIVFKKETLTN
jgi:hypothetical protein